MVDREKALETLLLKHHCLAAEEKTTVWQCIESGQCGCECITLLLDRVTGTFDRVAGTKRD